MALENDESHENANKYAINFKKTVNEQEQELIDLVNDQEVEL